MASIKKALRWYCIIIPLLTCINSCKPKNHALENEEILNITLELPENDARMLLSEMTSDVQYVALELSPKSLIVEIDKLQLDQQGNYYVLDKEMNRIIRFSSQGDYLNNIGTYGRGPEEYLQMDDFQLFDDFVKVYDNNGFMFTFHQDGSFVRKENVEKGQNAFLQLSDHLLFYGTCGGFCPDLTVVTAKNKTGFFTSPFQDYLRSNAYPFFDNGHDVYYSTLFEPYIYKIVHGEPEKLIHLDFGENNMPENSNLSPDELLLLYPSMFHINTISDTKIFFRYSHSNSIVHVIYDRKNKHYLTAKRIRNDLNFIPLGIPQGSFNNEHIFHYATLSGEDCKNLHAHIETLPQAEKDRLSGLSNLYQAALQDGLQLLVYYSLDKDIKSNPKGSQKVIH